MGYNTNFSGQLNFKHELTVPQLVALEEILGIDIRDNKEVQALKTKLFGDEYFYHIDLELTRKKDGIQWNGSEKTYGMVQCVTLVIAWMHKRGFTGFALEGQLTAQGEEHGDNWMLVMSKDGFRAEEKRIALKGKTITCPHCQKEFALAEAEDS